jgi:hypothetical protein
MPFAAAPPAGEHQVFFGLGVVSSQVGGILEASVWSLSDGDLLAALDGSSVALARLAAVRLKVIREARGRELAARQGACSMAVLLREWLRMRPGEASRLVRLAAALDDICTATGAALEAGVVSVDRTILRVQPATQRS